MTEIDEKYGAPVYCLEPPITPILPQSPFFNSFVNFGKIRLISSKSSKTKFYIFKNLKKKKYNLLKY